MKNPIGFYADDIMAFQEEAMRLMQEEAAEARIDTSMCTAPINPK